LVFMRAGAVVATRSYPETVPGTRREKAAPKGMRRTPLFGLVRVEDDPDYQEYRDVDPEPAPATDTLTEAEVVRLESGLRAQGLRPLGWRIEDDEAAVAVSDDHKRRPARTAGRAARALTDTVPGDVNWLGVTMIEDGVRLSHVRVLRRDVDAGLGRAGSPEEIWLNTALDTGSATAARGGWTAFDRRYPVFTWALYPEIRQHFGSGSDGGYRAQAYMTVAGELEVARGLSLSAALTRDIAGNLDGVPARAAGPRVRSDIARYVDEGKTAIGRATVDYTLRAMDDVYLRLSAGLFEPMYGGAGIEALYRPQGQDYAVGVDVNRVRQRDFDQLLGFRDYEAWTGHVRVYRDWSHLGLEAVVEAGRYLAGDWGGGMDVYRRFDNGVRFGAWFAVTDMPRSVFGRDRFAKGLYLTIPLDLVLPFSLRRDWGLEARALNRDGGQSLDRGPGLYELTRPGTERAIHGDWRNFLD
ncbi:MAG: YjbH domain-containing protein, partial [Sphingomonadales bacterium]